jgi:NAD(P)-dependent dehydrogenase (short-subunit alcohol dehydrogenase family)
MDNFEAVDMVDESEWTKVFSVNLIAPYRLMQRTIKLFLNKKSGNIINIASIGGLNGGRAGAVYTASKFALIGLTKNTGYLFAKKGIRCNAIAPGAVETQISDSIDYSKLTEDIKERIMPGLVLNPRNGKPIEIAKIALFLASEESSFVNGSVIVADGGWSAY